MLWFSVTVVVKSLQECCSVKFVHYVIYLVIIPRGTPGIAWGMAGRVHASASDCFDATIAPIHYPTHNNGRQNTALLQVFVPTSTVSLSAVFVCLVNICFESNSCSALATFNYKGRCLTRCIYGLSSLINIEWKLQLVTTHKENNYVKLGLHFLLFIIYETDFTP